MFILHLLLLFLLMFFNVKALYPYIQDDPSSPDMSNGFQASLAVVIGILSLMFSLTSILLVYAKFCRRRSSVQNNQQNLEGLLRSRSRFSGIDKTVIESLPFFRFSSLKGSRKGLECAVCLSKFEDIEVLRLLPKCKHAFHIDCVDQWLEKHSSCPLCRQKISADDLNLFTYSNSSRILWNHMELGDESNLELFVEREENRHGSSRFSIGSISCGKYEKGNKKEEELPIQQYTDCDEYQDVMHKFNHKIIVSDVFLKNRWSSVSSSDLLFLSSEMTNAVSTDRFNSQDSNHEQSATTRTIEDGQVMNSIKEEMERKRLFERKFSRFKQSDSFPFPGFPIPSDSNENSSHTSKMLNPNEKRSMSEITSHPRFTGFNRKNCATESSVPDENRVEEERLRKIWLPIAQRTVQWFADRERRSPPQTQNKRQSLNV